MSIQGPWFITRAALDDYSRLVGSAAPAPRADLEAQIASAHYVKTQGDGSEVWRGGKPLRLRFIVRISTGVGGDAPQLVRVEGDHAGRAAPRARRVSLWDGEMQVELDVTQEVLDPGPQRRIAYRLADGMWFTGFRSRARPDAVDRGMYTGNPPDWVREQRGQRPRRGGRGGRGGRE
jgi:hypothetical protein